MHKTFDHGAIEKKWQAKWTESGLHRTDVSSSKEKMFVLDMFPYPSGEGLHVGHPKGYIATDVYSRFKKMSGYEILHPMGWDAFGLPAENFAIKHKVHPRVAVEKNISNFKEQLAHLGFNYDWEHEINTTDPEYYKWTQWIFLKLLERGLAYESHEPINWCPSCQTGLANEDLESDGTCERCGSQVEKRPMRQWVLKITAYADRMLEDLATLTKWPEHIKEAQRNWIGKSEGAMITFSIKDSGEAVTVFTTRPDTLFGATYMVLAPEHPLVSTLVVENREEIDAYVAKAAATDTIERTNATKEKTGVELKGIKAINPANGEEISVYIADYVLSTYGTGAIMGVPAHDERDFAFASTYGIPMRQVVLSCKEDTKNPPQEGFPEVKRDTVVVFLRNTENGKIALLNWHGTLEGIVTGVMGGIEEGMTPEEAALAEIAEEVAIPNARIVKQLPWISSARYCASHKQENRVSVGRWFIAEVDGLAEQGEIPNNEAAKHTLVWVDEADVFAHLTPDDQRSMWSQFQTLTPMTNDGVLINSGEFDGMGTEEAKLAITKKVGGERTSTYRLNDWVFSRQRYWGEPIPVVHCEKCGVVPVPYEELPVRLPEVEHYEPTGTGESPLASIDEWVNTACSKCGGAAKRETNTMPQWAGSSWYYLRFIDPKNNDALIDPALEKKWAPVDVYVGGDHAVRHLIYARFWHKFLYDIGVVHTIEPFERLEFLGFILAEDGRKMSKRWGNIINPDDIVAQHGADTLRVYEMFMGPFENTVAWSTNSLVGAQRFLERAYGLRTHVADTESTHMTSMLHKTIAKVASDIETFKFNTAVSAMMIYLNDAEKHGLSKDSYQAFLKLLAPFAPHVTEELWEQEGNAYSIHTEAFPEADPALLIESEVVIGAQVNGKLRGQVAVAPDADETTATAAARLDENVARHLAGKEVVKVIYVPKRIINFIVK